jgi:RHS repeat-associated protein
VQHIEYVPFGEVFIEERNNTWNTPYLFNAKELDEETGLYYYGARYYEPRISVWYGADPMQEKYTNVSSYAYCGNNPVRYIDPDGKDWVMVTNKNGGRSPVWDTRVTNQTTATEYYGKSAYYLGKEHQYTGVGNRQINLNTNGTWTDVTQYHKSISDGEMQSDDVVQNRITALERKSLKSVQGVVLHRTASSNTEGTLHSFQIGRDGVNYGTHFLVGKDGTIYQTANLDKYTLHVGKTRNKSFPNNLNSIGIEVVGNYNSDTHKWEPLTSAQIEAVANLTNYLMVTYKLPSSALYIHENISYKTEGEGGTVLNAIQSKLIKE